MKQILVVFLMIIKKLFYTKEYGSSACFEKCTDSVLYNDYELMNGCCYANKSSLNLQRL